MRKKETPNPSRMRGRGVEVSETLFYPKYGTKCHKPLKNRSFLEVCKFCDKIKKLKKGLEMGGKVVYNESKW